MSDQPLWRPLPVSAAGIPNLLISSSFTSQSYTVHVTDLANVWSETMDRKRLVGRGLEKDISIDLTDGADQIRRMLDYLQAAFDPSDPEHGNTSVSLSRSNDDGESLVVRITCILPKVLNLKPLEWPMILRKSPQTTIAYNLVIPLVQSHRERSREVDHLISSLREKDAVIARLVDKLEANGTGLEHVFTSLAGKRKVTRATAEQRIKGLAPFDEPEFRSLKRDGDHVLADMPVLLNSVFREDGFKSNLDIDKSIITDRWWESLGSGKDLILVDRGKGGKEEPKPPPTEPESSIVEEDEFQIQSSPPPRNRKRPSASPSPVHHRPPPPDDDDETASDLDSPPTHSSQPKALGPRIGAIGGNTNVPPPPKPSSPPKPPKKPVQDDSETASDSDDDDTGPPASAPAQEKRSVQPIIGGIGRIGGIGSIGGKAKPPAEPQVETTQSASEAIRGRSRERRKQKEEAKPEPRETSTERADRKRRELRQEQEARAAAGPAKKKRRF